MLNSSWKRQLSEKLKLPAGKNNLQRLAIVGLGAELNGDDAAGVIAARKLMAALKDNQSVLVLEGGTLPENITSPLRRFMPEAVIFIDAADFSGQPGEIRLIDPARVGGGSFSTHSIPLSMLSQYLASEIGCQVIIIGIQPISVHFGDPISLICRRAVGSVVSQFRKIV